MAFLHLRLKLFLAIVRHFDNLSRKISRVRSREEVGKEEILLSSVPSHPVKRCRIKLCRIGDRAADKTLEPDEIRGDRNLARAYS